MIFLTRRISFFLIYRSVSAGISGSSARYHHFLSSKYSGTTLQFLIKALRRMSCQVKELKIPVPYGFIAAKAWGSDTGLPVLALHGWQDNAGTFDNLIPLLSPSLYIVAIDSLGHGLSSHKPPGTFYHYMEILVDIERVVQYLKWEQFSIIGHSLGGTLALMYGSIFPDKVPNIVLLDIIKPASRAPEALPDITKSAVGELLNFERKMVDPAPVYSPEDAKTRLMQGMYGEITESSAEVLMRRGTKPSPCRGGLVFTRDIRVRAMESLQKLSHDDLKAYMKKLKCNMLIVLGKDSIIFRSRTPEVLDDFLNIYRKMCKTFQIVEVEGNHFVHLNQADRVAPHVNSFFDSCLRDASKL